MSIIFHCFKIKIIIIINIIFSSFTNIYIPIFGFYFKIKLVYDWQQKLTAISLVLWFILLGWFIDQLLKKLSYLSFRTTACLKCTKYLIKESICTVYMLSLNIVIFTKITAFTFTYWYSYYLEFRVFPTLYVSYSTRDI